MVVINKSNKIIGFGGAVVLPGERKEIPDTFASNPVLNTYAKLDIIKVVAEEKAPAEKPKKK